MASTRRETSEFADMLERMIRTYGRRVGDGDEVDLRRMLELQGAFDSAIQVAVDGQRTGPLKASWAYIAGATGKTRQAAFARWGSAA